MSAKSAGQLPGPETGDSPGRARRYLKYAVACLAAFGIFGAVGSLVVNKLYSSAGEALNPQEPALISVTEDPQCSGDCVFAVATRSPAGVNAKVRGVKGCGTLYAAMKGAGAVDVGAVMEGATVKAGTRHSVTIVGMHARIIKRQPALDGALAFCAPAGEVSAIGVLFNLDEDVPAARKLIAPADLSVGGPYFASGNTIQLGRDETQPFMLVGLTTRRDYVQWDVVADVVIDGHRQTITIDDNGRPFRVTGVPRGFKPKSGLGYKRYIAWLDSPPKLWVANRPDGPYCPMPAPYTDCRPWIPDANGAHQSLPTAFYADLAEVPYSTPVIRPSELVLTRDRSLVVKHLRWKNWDGALARADGVLRAGNCKPRCAQRFNDPARVTLSHPENINGREVYGCYQLSVPATPTANARGCLQKTRIGYTYPTVAHQRP